MLIGQWEQHLDAEQHVNIPEAARDAFAGGAVLTRGLDGGLWLFPLGRWQALADHLASLPLLKAARRQLERFLFANASLCHLDEQGRIPIPQALRDWAGIESRVVILGLNAYLELWAPGAWAERQRMSVAQANEAAASIGSL